MPPKRCTQPTPCAASRLNSYPRTPKSRRRATLGLLDGTRRRSSRSGSCHGLLQKVIEALPLRRKRRGCAGGPSTIRENEPKHPLLVDTIRLPLLLQARKDILLELSERVRWHVLQGVARAMRPLGIPPLLRICIDKRRPLVILVDLHESDARQASGQVREIGGLSTGSERKLIAFRVFGQMRAIPAR